MRDSRTQLEHNMLSQKTNLARRWCSATSCIAATLLIAACGGGGSSADTAGGPPGIQGATGSTDGTTTMPVLPGATGSTDGTTTMPVLPGATGSTDGTPNLPALQITTTVAANIVSPVTGQEVKLSPSIVFTGTGTVPAGATVTQVRWNFGDGSPVLSISNAASITSPQFKAYASTGTYIVTFAATAGTAESGSVTRMVTVSSSAATGQLNDTGIDWCTENITTPSIWVNNAVCRMVAWGTNLWGPQQDAYFGRDAQAAAGTLTKIGSGDKGFDYTRLGADGQPLAIQNATWADTGSNAAGTRWECVKDNVTGLIWEVKTKHDPTALRHYTATFTWFNPDNTKNGGSAGTEVSGTAAVCNGVADSTKCNTQAYTTAVNAVPTGQALCGFRDWRLPSKDDLISLAHLGRFNSAIDTANFPDVNSSTIALGIPEYGGATWSSSPSEGDSIDAFIVSFNFGVGGLTELKETGLSARLVRSGK